MLFWRAFASVSGFLVLNLNLTTCRSNNEEAVVPGPKAPPSATAEELVAVDTADMTKLEKKNWATYVGEILAPCADQPVSIAQCIQESRPCDACLPAAEFIAKRVRRGEPRGDIEAAFRQRFSSETVKPVPIGDAPWKGSADAPVVIVEWADFECPFCRAAAPVMDDLVRRYPDGVKLVFKNYPLGMHPHAEVAAKAVLAARLQGKFWKLHEALFDPKLGELDPKAILRVAATLGLDMKKLEADMASKAVADVLGAEKAEASALGLQGTPLLFINGREYDLGHFKLVSEGEAGAVAAEDIDDWITLELKLTKGAPAPGKPSPAASAVPPAPSAVPASPEPTTSAVPTRIESLRPAPSASASP